MGNSERVEATLPVVVSAPGKLILMGEHAVVYGRPALVAAVDRRLTARFTSPPRSAGVHLALTQLGHTEELPWEEIMAYARDARRRWERYAAAPGAAAFQAVRGDDPAHVVKVALGETAEALGETAPPHLALAVGSELPIGSGFGSSAATAVAVVAGYLAWRGAALEPERVLRLALEVERRQHGMPSGADGATVFQGGILWTRRGAGDALEREPVAARSPLLGGLRVYDTGTPPEPTGAVVAAVRERRHADPRGVEGELGRIEAATRAFRVELERAREDPPAVVELMREAEAGLEALGVVPAAVRELVRRVEAEGGAAKISGAGSLRGPAAGTLLVYHAEPARVASWPFLRPLSPHPVALGASGFRREAA